jgi:ribosomal protein S18 acetylase RimI-like enzyme
MEIYIKQKDKKVARAELKIQNSYCFIKSLEVKQGFRGQGLGNKLLRKVKQSAKKLGAEFAFIYLEYKNVLAQNMFLGAGFEKMDSETGFCFMKIKL